MSEPMQPVPVSVVPDTRPTEVVVISHSPLFYWWPVWAVGFLMAAVTFWRDERIAFVPPGTVAEQGVQVKGHDGRRDILIAPADQPLPSSAKTEELKQPRMRMASSNNPGIIWAITLFIVIVVVHVKMRGIASVVVVISLGAITILLAILGLWDPITRMLGIIDILPDHLLGPVRALAAHVFRVRPADVYHLHAWPAAGAQGNRRGGKSF